ncbi:MAG: hypothetical protein R8K21_02135 [Mariprofundales bacterium]
MRVQPVKLLSQSTLSSSYYYLFGADKDYLIESAEALFAKFSQLHAQSAIDFEEPLHTLRLDVDELPILQQTVRQQDLFSLSNKCVYVIIRNVQSANDKQSKLLLKIIESPPSIDTTIRLILCAPQVKFRKKLHQSLLAIDNLVYCRFDRPTPQIFNTWIHEQLRQYNLNLDEQASNFLCERVAGMRQAAIAAMQRLKTYTESDEDNKRINIQTLAALLGEQAPTELIVFCHAFGMRNHDAIIILYRLLHTQQLAPIQIIRWLQMRLRSALLYAWYSSQGERDPTRLARLFGDARHQVPKEVRCWQPAELMQAIFSCVQVEIDMKSGEDGIMVLERFVLKWLNVK